MKTVWLKFGAFSNITYHHEVDTGYSREQWDAMTEEERTKEVEAALWEDIDYWDEDQDGEDEDEDEDDEDCE